MPFPLLLSQQAPTAATLFYLTILFIFLTAIITTVVTKWARDKCLKLFRGYHVTIQRSRGLTIWGRLKVFSAGVEITYDFPYVDPRGRRKNSYMFYQHELEPHVLSIMRYHDELTADDQKRRQRQVRRMFRPGIAKRIWRWLRNFINTLRDAFNAAIGAVVSQYQRTNPASAVLTTQGGAVTNIGQTLIGRFANAYEPLLEQYIGQPVILEVADPINPNNKVQEFAGFLADYTQHFIAIFNVDHCEGRQVIVTLPDVEKGDALPPIPPPPPPGAPAPVLPPPLAEENGVATRVDGKRFKLQNVSHQTLAVRRLEREGFEPLSMGMLLPPNATLSLPARDARGARLVCDVVEAMDIIAPRKWATVRHAGDLPDRRGLAGELSLDRLPLVSRLFSSPTDEQQER